jgi:uncharacterized surface protein with fasciclin (FAS1) repeats
MSDQGGRDPEPTEFFPPLPNERRDETGTSLPPIGTERDPEPTRVLPPPGPDPGPTEPLPPVGGPYDPGPPYDGGDGGGGGDDGGDGFGFDQEPEPWWRQPGPLAALIAGVAALLVGVIALIVWAGDGDDSSDDTLPVLPTSSTLTSSTAVSTSSTLPETTTSTSTTVPATTTTTTTPPTTTTTTAPPTTTTTTAPPTTTTTAPPTTTTTIPVVTVPDPGGATTWDVISNSPDLAEMRDAIEQAGLVDLFNSDGPITALASSNTAFQNLRAAPGGEELLDDPDRLAALLRRQVVVASVSAAEFPLFGELQSAATPEDCELLGADEDCGLLQGGGDSENPTVDGASFLVTDVDSSNGLLDVIDRVLVP